MIHSLFSLPIYHTNLKHQIDVDSIRERLKTEFEKSSNLLSPLEKQGGISTYSTNNQLHTSDYLEKLNSLIFDHVKIYWKVLDIEEGLNPEIDQCWSNIHYNQSFTSYHSHSLHPIVATFYVSAAKNCGNLILINQMEYGITHIPYNVPIESKCQSEIEIQTGDLVLFPGWVRHMTGENRSGHDRIVISYNMRFSGTYLASNVPYPSINSANNSEVNFLRNKIANLEFIVETIKRDLQK